MSGSMETLRADTIGGFNNYLNRLREDDSTDVLVSLTTFHNTDQVQPLRPLAEVPALTRANYEPMGGTALYDALGNFFNASRWFDTGDPQLLLIITDGHENSSRRYTKQAIVNEITSRKAVGNWTFAYLGANQDAWDEGSQINIHATLTYQPDSTGTRYMWDSVYNNTTSLRSYLSNTMSESSVPDFFNQTNDPTTTTASTSDEQKPTAR